MQAWYDFLKRQELRLGKDIVDKWLHGLKIVHFDSGNLYLEAKATFEILWFEEHIRPHLKSGLINNNHRQIKVHLTLGAAQSPPITTKSFKKEKYPPLPPVDFTPDPLDPSLTLQNLIVSNANQVIFRFFCELTGYNLNSQKLDNSKVNLATFNPIYLWGPPGCGKTHLLCALTHAFKEQGINALYARAETFTEHVVAAIRGSAMQSFRKAYRNVDVLLIDDVHAFARKNATQEEFFHTFNTLQLSGRQIILSSQYTPSLLNDIEPRLISRFEWGINLHWEKINSSDLTFVLQNRCAALHFPLSEEVSDFLIKSFNSCPSMLQALDALILRCHLEKDARYKRNPRLMDVPSVQKMLSDLIDQQHKTALNSDKIIAAVASIYGIRKEDLLGKSQTQECCLPRQIAMYLCRYELKLALQGIGRIFNRDHSTVMTSIQIVKNKINSPDQDIVSSLSEIKKLIIN